MSRSKTSTWVLGTVVVGLLLAVAGWFLLVSPKMTDAALVNTEAEGVEASNVALAQRVTVLEQQFAEIDTFKAELAGLRTQIPADDDIADYLRYLDQTAAATDVELVAIIGSGATDLVPVPETVAAALGSTETVVPVAPAAEDAGAPDAAAPAPTDASVPVETSAVAVQVPITLNVKGGYAAVHAFLDQLQQSSGRLLLVTGVSVAAQQAGQDGEAATQSGDAEATLTAFLYARPVDLVPATGTEVTDPAAVVPLPVPDPGKNPLVPVG